jgi:hypothetical protein
MPVTAKLSRKFYETLGDDLANELVEWFNAVDLTYRSQLRELNEINFARFDAKVEQRLVELEARLGRRMDEFETRMGERLTALEAKVDREIAGLRREFARDLGELKSDVMKWMFIFWAGSTATTLGAIAAAIAVLR